MTNVSIIKKFCKSGNTRLLKNLDKVYAVLFQKLCLYSLSMKNTNKTIAKKVLEYYGIDENGNRKGLKDKGRKKAENELKSMSVALTGARPGDIITGISKGTKGGVIAIHKIKVPPQKSHLDMLRYYPDLWKLFIEKLGSIPFFAEMNNETREVWLEVNEVGNEHTIGEEGSRLEVLQIGSGIFSEKLTDKQLQQLIEGNPDSHDNYWTNKEIESMVPRKAGSKARKHTLVLIRPFWKIAIDYEISKEYSGLVIDVNNGSFSEGKNAKEDQHIYVIGSITKKLNEILKGGIVTWERSLKDGTQHIGLLVNKNRFNSREIRILMNEIYSADYDIIIKSFKNFTGASHKSLIQKIVRFRPDKVDIGRGKLFDAQAVLIASMAELAIHPGAFIPDIQRFVTGIESLSKRLAVIAYEDSFVSEKEFNVLLSLFSGSLLSQRVRTWFPSRDLLKTWLQFGLSIWNEKRAYKFDFMKAAKEKPYILDSKNNILQNCSAIMDELRSFQVDLGLVRDLANFYPNMEIVYANTTPEVMPIGFCVDHHWAPQIAYYFDQDFVRKTMKNPSEPFKGLFNTIWDYCSSVNPRRKMRDFSKFTDNPVVSQIANAQKLF